MQSNIFPSGAGLLHELVGRLQVGALRDFNDGDVPHNLAAAELIGRVEREQARLDAHNDRIARHRHQ
jgi:hypothetical protein